MDINKMCPGCMREIENKESMASCPSCGYDLRNFKVEPHQMKPFTILAGKYMIGKVIGEGGFGISYLGYDLNLELAVAIKEFYPNGFVTRESSVTAMVSIYTGKNEADVSKWRDGFINEARNLAKFSNLNGIVEVRDFFYENGTAYIVMEYIDGITLKQYLKQNGGKIPADKTFSMMEPVVRSLSKVHDAGIIHRDISPDNIMITKYGGMKLLDFGAAREFAGNAEKSLSIMLKPGYAPEEQYRSRGKQGPWSDVYALAATIYKCITGVTPIESMERMRADTLTWPKEMGVKISDAQDMAIRQGMAVYAENRLRSMDEFYRALYSGNAVQAPKPADIATPPESTQTASPENVNAGEGSTPSGNKARIIAISAAVTAVCLLLITVCIALLSGGKDDMQTSSYSQGAAETAPAVPAEEVDLAESITPTANDIYVDDVDAGSQESAETSESVNEVKAIAADAVLYASATSELSERNMTHAAGRILDGDLSQAWVEGAAGQGIGESVTVIFDTVYRVQGISIYAGYHKSEDLYYKNARPREIELSFSDGTNESYELADIMAAQDIRFADAHDSSYIRITIRSVYPGNKYDDTAISEVRVY